MKQNVRESKVFHGFQGNVVYPWSGPPAHNPFCAQAAWTLRKPIVSNSFHWFRGRAEVLLFSWHPNCSGKPWVSNCFRSFWKTIVYYCFLAPAQAHIVFWHRQRGPCDERMVRIVFNSFHWFWGARRGRMFFLTRKRQPAKSENVVFQWFSRPSGKS